MISQSLQGTENTDLIEEIANQRTLLQRMEPMRLVSSLVAFGLMTIYLPPWLTLAAMGCDLMFEGIGYWLMRDMAPAKHRGRYIMVLACIALMEISYTVPCLMIWQLDVHFAKALAVGLVCMTLFQLTTVRAIHLPFGLAGWSAGALVTLVGNAFYWMNTYDWIGLILSTLGVLAAMIYTLGLMHSNHALHREISERSGEAASANRAKGRFLAQMSHELRTPLNAILGMGEAELALSKSEGTQDRMQTLVSSARGLALILDDILEMSALNETGLPIRPIAIHPIEVIAATVALFRPVFANAGLELNLTTEDADTRVKLDPHRLRQCLSNLLSNALKFTDHGGVTVRTWLKSDGVLHVYVIDTGRGIAPHQVELMFQPFLRGTSEQSGSGLGLAISRGLARQMGGDLVLHPSSSGAHFLLTVQTEPVTEPQLDAPEQVLCLKGKRIMVVDDIATNRLVAATYLRILSAEVTEISSGIAAVQAVRFLRPDLILLDMNMPGLSGLETLAELRTLPGGHIPVLAMTADASDGFRQQYCAAGLDGYIGKPLTMATLTAALAPHLGTV